MNSVFIKERQKYTKEELFRMFSLDEESWRAFRDVLGKKKVLISASSDTEKDGFEIDEDDSDDGIERYLFKYVGIIIFRSWVIKCYPKYINSFDDLIEKLKIVLQVIRKDKSNNNSLLLLDESDTDSNNRLSLMMGMLDDYFENGVYTNDTNIYEINGTGEIDWNKTVNYMPPIISKSSPIYVELYTRRRIINDYDYFRRLHECILTDCSHELDQLDLVDLLSVTTVELSEDSIEDFGDIDYILYRLQNERSVQFNTRKNLVLDYMELYVKQHYATKNKNSMELYGTTSFNLVWEDVCADVFDSQLKKPIMELDIPNGLQERYKVYKNLLDVIAKPKWGRNKVEAKKTLKPDLIALRRHGKEIDFIILDAKYYNIVIEVDKVKGQPGVEDLTKQYTYQLAYKAFLEDHNITSVKNCFLMPTDCDYVIDYDDATLEAFEQIGLESIQIRLLPALTMYKKYLSGSLYDVDDLALFKDS